MYLIQSVQLAVFASQDYVLKAHISVPITRASVRARAGNNKNYPFGIIIFIIRFGDSGAPKIECCLTIGEPGDAPLPDPTRVSSLTLLHPRGSECPLGFPPRFPWIPGLSGVLGPVSLQQ